MVFSSLVFLSIFLPVVFVLYTIIPNLRLKNILLLVASLVFYAYGEPVYVLLMIGSALLNYIWAVLMEKFPQHKKIVLVLSVVENLGILALFKYVGLWELPIGISFFTFQAMSYVFDVSKGEVKSQRNFGKLLLYISFFPQLIAGPIVKYHDIEKELTNRQQSVTEVAAGIRRFVVGLSKKVLIANYMGAVADTLFASGNGDINVLAAWLGAVAYMLQIYFDFSGYSDMAIGLGRMFGFHFKENFRYPYTANSIRDFWRKWHMSLSGWFKEYLYIPLGGNRKGRVRTCVNKVIVFACTGIWHGANFTFLFWGLYHGFFLILEEYVPFFRRKGSKGKQAVLHVYALLVVLIGFVFFRADTITQGFFWVGQMFTGFHFESSAMRLVMSILTPVNLLAAAAGIIGSLPWIERVENNQISEKISWVVSFGLLFLCMLNLAGGTYNPFIYFRF